MKTKRLLKTLCVVVAFTALSVGVCFKSFATCYGDGGIGKGKCTFAGRCGNVYPGDTSDCDGDDLGGIN
jgi:hypothetical protein